MKSEVYLSHRKENFYTVRQESSVTIKQVEWANRHDWYVNCEKSQINHDEWIVLVSDGDKIIRFENFAKLKWWAGY